MPTLAASSADIRAYPMQFVKGVGPKVAELFLKLGIATVGDFLDTVPRSYQDRRNIPSILQLQSGDNVICFGAIRAVNQQKVKGKMNVFKAELCDASGSLMAIWFNQAYLKKVITPGKQIILCGKLTFNSYFGEKQLLVNDWEFYDPLTDKGLSLGSIVPIYGLTEGLYQARARHVGREIVSTQLPKIIDPLGDQLARWNLLPLADALRQLHFPEGRETFRAARRRVTFDEFFYLQLALQIKRAEQVQIPKTVKHLTTGTLLAQYYGILPFELTGAQKRVIAEILADMGSDRVMNRLVQGDVGAGKTEVAIAAICVAIQSGYQAALMAPTEILAEQHYHKLKRYLTSLNITCHFLVGKLKKAEKQAVLAQVDRGEPCVVIGTHALIQEKVSFQKLGVVIIDEQHRFGVRQRMELQNKGYNPDVLLLTATPIPRSLSLTLYGDLDKSLLDEKPVGRQNIKTYFERSSRKQKVFDFVRSRLKIGDQAYVVYPLVEESAKLELLAATESAAELQQSEFPDYKVGLLHGRMKPDEKAAVMDAFRAGEIHVLVSTTVIEVGVDVPNAAIMVIEHAERFGLSQLHQLRGRVGRGTAQGYCFLLGDPKGQESRRRLKALVDSSDGFKIAEVDLQIRGPGDFFGVRQSGIPDFKVADLIRDEAILIEAKKRAQEVLGAGKILSPLVEQELWRRMGEFLGGARLN